MNNQSNRSRGDLGERLAYKFLQQKGFEIIDTNVHLGKHSELDIVAIQNDVLHIIEVKTRITCGYHGENPEFPVHNVTRRKLSHIIKGANMYIQSRNLTHLDCTIDVVGVVVDKVLKKAWIQIFPNILEGID